ncbi:MAG: hypothetical protein ABSC38_07855 [Verrucomicrobiia bacterium]
MADEKPVPSQEDSKRDTVRINLPPTGPGGVPSAGGPSTVKLKTISVGGTTQTSEEKEATVIISRPTAPGVKPKSDTSHVEVAGAKPTTPATPRPTLKLRREDGPAPTPEPAPATPSTAKATPAPAPVSAIAAAPSGMDNIMAIVAMVLAVAVTAYLAYVAFA